MPITTLTIVRDGTGAITGGTETEKGLIEGAIDIVSMPFGVGAADTEFVSKSTAAYGSLAWGIGMGLMGEAYGHKRERDGSQSLIPLFRG